jgi:hypothetical protein
MAAPASVEGASVMSWLVCFDLKKTAGNAEETSPDKYCPGQLYEPRKTFGNGQPG